MFRRGRCRSKRGQEFDPPYLHHKEYDNHAVYEPRGYFFVCVHIRSWVYEKEDMGKNLYYEALVALQDGLYRTKSVVSPWGVQFSFKLYSLMLTSEIIAILAMISEVPGHGVPFVPWGH